METTTHTLDTADGPMELYEARPDSADANGAAIVVIQEAFGVNDHIRDVTRRFAAVGYHAVAPSLFHRSGGGTAPYDDFAQVLPLFESVDDTTIMTDVDAALDHLRAAGFADGRIGLVGFCMGGRVSFLVAVSRPLGAAVGFYGGGIVSGRFPQFPPLIDRAGELRTPWLGLFGDEDASIPVEDVETLRTALADVPVETQIVRYTGAGHGFHCDVRDSYDPDAAADAWQRSLDFFGARLRS